MIERGSGRTSGLTDWRLMDVLSMWACVQDQDTAGQWKQVAGWRKVCDLALAHLSRLREYRRGLAEAWPPETNAAARSYIAELDQLIERVQRTHDAAAANYDALAAAARAIGSARAELQPLHEEYAKKLRQKQAYEATIADPKAVAGSRLPERPPVTDDDLEQLNVRARGLMTGLSGELQHAQVMLQRPPAPKKWPGRDDGATLSNEAPSIPSIPPVIPTPLVTSVRSDAAPRPDAYKLNPTTPASSVIGPVLGGAHTGIAPTPQGSALAPALTPGTTPPHPGLGGPPLIPGSLGSTPRTPQPPQVRESSPSGKTVANNREGIHRTMSPPTNYPGGLIGGVPGTGQSASSMPQRRINPVGGVIGGGGAGTAPTGAAGSRPGSGRLSNPEGFHGAPPLGGAPGFGPTRTGGSPRTSGTHQNDDHEPSWNPDHPWVTKKGVPPIVIPPEDEGPIDPGPAIGLGR
ncbi:hypothetical protein NMK34_04815 [Micromonospora sp. BRA006-A]|uniref:hypothetical protein n=1 Tax=Micromonospora sp. BRA006-A TaxID=2962860 RepID=UPI00296F839B|nr:hypothetical protein [Micromonospora sp. BRA006-A]MDW3845922.1 hypothetical protein [Micromonospora sp. BRA006-A]